MYSCGSRTLLLTFLCLLFLIFSVECSPCQWPHGVHSFAVLVVVSRLHSYAPFQTVLLDNFSRITLVCSINLGGRCATPSRCPKGFNVNKSGRVLPYSGKMTAPTYPFWPRNWGQQCYKYPNKGAPGYQNPSVSSNNRNSGGGNCAAMNHVCNSKPCCGGLKCGMMLRDKNRYCGP